MTPAEARAAWVTALRSGNYLQTTGTLRNPVDSTYCCLGVACEVAIENGIDLVFDRDRGGYVATSEYEFAREARERDEERDDAEYEEYVVVYESELPTAVQSWLGLADDSGTFRDPILDGEGAAYNHLIAVNDDALYDFTEIANLIESGRVQTRD